MLFLFLGCNFRSRKEFFIFVDGAGVWYGAQNYAIGVFVKKSRQRVTRNWMGIVTTRYQWGFVFYFCRKRKRFLSLNRAKKNVGDSQNTQWLLQDDQQHNSAHPKEMAVCEKTQKPQPRCFRTVYPIASMKLETFCLQQTKKARQIPDEQYIFFVTFDGSPLRTRLRWPTETKKILFIGNILSVLLFTKEPHEIWPFVVCVEPLEHIRQNVSSFMDATG